MALPDPFAQRAIASAHRAARRGAELTGKLLAFSRRQTLLPAPIRIPELLSAFRDLLARTLGPNIEIIVTTDPELPLALADSGQLETALLNLAVNARDAMPAGGKLGIEASEVVLEGGGADETDDLRAGRYVRLSVSDTGTGMSRETRHVHSSPSTRPKAVGKGSGLGSAWSMAFAKQSAGHVTAYSEIGGNDHQSVLASGRGISLHRDPSSRKLPPSLATRQCWWSRTIPMSGGCRALPAVPGLSRIHCDQPSHGEHPSARAPGHRTAVH